MSINLNKVRYMYFGNRSKHNTHVITVAFTRDDNKIYFGVAYCNKDDNYNKQFGKQLACERLVTNGTDGIDIIPGNSIYDTIWDYLYYGARGQRLTYNKPSWVDDVMLVDAIMDRYHNDTTQSLWKNSQRTSFFGKVLKFFKIK